MEVLASEINQKLQPLEVEGLIHDELTQRSEALQPIHDDETILLRVVHVKCGQRDLDKYGLDEPTLGSLLPQPCLALEVRHQVDFTLAHSLHQQFDGRLPELNSDLAGIERLADRHPFVVRLNVAQPSVGGVGGRSEPIVGGGHRGVSWIMRKATTARPGGRGPDFESRARSDTP